MARANASDRVNGLGWAGDCPAALAANAQTNVDSATARTRELTGKERIPGEMKDG
jgi:hypothetical protein